MKISKNLPQFNRQKALIIASGKTKIRLLFAHQGEIKEVDRIHIKPRKYSDREGFFQTRSRNLGTLYSGSVKESVEEEKMKKLLRKLEDKVKKINKKFKVSSIYLFSPNYLKKDIKKIIPKNLRKKVRLHKSGNYLKSRLLKFPNLIAMKRKKLAKRKKTKANMSKEARKIVKRSKRARKKIKGKP